ncbi:MAG: TIGR00296 family protein [Candidatus Micrarchaeia archaeon]
MHVYNIEEGRTLVRVARNAIELYIRNPHFDKRVVESSIEQFNDYYGVFVTLEHYPTKTLRGCIGFPKAIGPIKSSLLDAALGAAFDDPRFVPVSVHELDSLVVEVSILSEPKELEKDFKKRLDGIEVGRDGLLIEYGFYSGLLLPIVPVEEKWNKEQFLEETCIKAGLPVSYWKRADVKLYKFETQIFREEEPGGNVREVNLKGL